MPKKSPEYGGDPERIELTMLYDDMQQLFRDHESEIITFNRTVAILSGYIPRPEESNIPEYGVLVMNYVENSKPLFLVKIALDADEDGPSVNYVIGHDQAKYSNDDNGDMSPQDIRLQRDVMREVVIDNEEAQHLVNFMNDAREELGYDEGGFS